MKTSTDSDCRDEILSLTANGGCIHCGTCTAVCPMAKENVLLPRRLLRLAHLGRTEDLLDMEGRFGDISAEGTRTGEIEYALGILYYAKEPGEYRMWHYSGSGDVFTVVMDVDVAKREMQYTKEYSEGRIGRFHLAIGDDGVWITKLEILQPDQTWRQTMEFRMERVRP